jgi:hypothetical protein
VLQDAIAGHLDEDELTALRGLSQKLLERLHPGAGCTRC